MPNARRGVAASRQLCGDFLAHEEQLARVQVTTIDAFANRVVCEVTGRPLFPDHGH